MARALPLELLARCPCWNRLNGGTLVVACSGGRDSVALACAAAELLRDEGFSGRFAKVPALKLWYLDHGLRTVSAEDAEFVRRLAAKLGAAAVVETCSIDPSSGNIEEQARNERYERLFRFLEQADGPAVALTAHHLSDQAETILHHIVRGTQLRGLRGIAPEVDGVIFRPWLELPPDGIAQFLNAAGQDWREDATNSDTTLTRNFLRHEVLPRLRQLNPAADTHIAQLARSARLALSLAEQRLDRLEIEEFRKHSVDRWLPLVAWPAGEAAAFRLEEGWEPDLAAQFIARWLRHAGIELNGADHLLLDEWGGGEGEALTLRNHRFCVLKRRVLQVLTPETGEIDAQEKLLMPGEQARMGGLEAGVAEAGAGQWRKFRERGREAWEQIRAWPEALDRLSASPPELPSWHCFLPEGTAFPLTLRDWREGDRIELSGGGGSKKLGDVFTDAKIPACFRSVWAVLADAEGRILWVPGLADSAAMRIADGTAPAYCVSLRETM